MPVPDFILSLRQKIGHDPLWLPGITAAILRSTPAGPEILLVRQVPTGRWTLIGGCIEPGEDPDQAAVREVLEETGVRVQLDRLLSIKALPEATLPNDDVVQFLEIGFCGHPVDDAAPHVADDESDAVGWFAVDALPTLLERHRRLIDLAVGDQTATRYGQAERQLTPAPAAR